MFSLRRSLARLGRFTSLRAAARRAELGTVPPSARAVIASTEIDATYRAIRGRPDIFAQVGLQKSPLVRLPDGFGKHYGGSQIVVRSGDAGPGIVRTWRINVRLQAIYCHQRCDDSATGPANEPYLIMTTFCPGNAANVHTVKVGAYGGVEDGWFLPVHAELATDATNDDVAVIAQLFEHDSGDPEEVEAKVRDLMLRAAATFAPAVEDYQLVDGWVGDIVDVATGWFVELFGMADDLVGPPASFEIPYGLFRDGAPSLPEQEIRGLRYHYKLEHAADDGHYASYYYVTATPSGDPVPI